MFGTKRPSITSRWMYEAPFRSTSPICSAMRPKSADRIDGAILVAIGIGRLLADLRLPEQRVVDEKVDGGRADGRHVQVKFLTRRRVPIVEIVLPRSVAH